MNASSDVVEADDNVGLADDDSDYQGEANGRSSRKKPKTNQTFIKFYVGAFKDANDDILADTSTNITKSSVTRPMFPKLKTHVHQSDTLTLAEIKGYLTNALQDDQSEQLHLKIADCFIGEIGDTEQAPAGNIRRTKSLKLFRILDHSSTISIPKATNNYVIQIVILPKSLCVANAASTAPDVPFQRKVHTVASTVVPFKNLVALAEMNPPSKSTFTVIYGGYHFKGKYLAEITSAHSSPCK